VQNQLFGFQFQSAISATLWAGGGVETAGDERALRLFEKGVSWPRLQEEDAPQVRAPPWGVRPVDAVEVLAGEGEGGARRDVAPRAPVRCEAREGAREAVHVLLQGEAWGGFPWKRGVAASLEGSARHRARTHRTNCSIGQRFRPALPNEVRRVCTYIRQSLVAFLCGLRPSIIAEEDSAGLHLLGSITLALQLIPIVNSFFCQFRRTS